MKAQIIKIGNSMGIRIPKPILEQTNMGTQVEMEVVDKQIIIRSARRPRQGWDSAFRLMAEKGHDRLLDAESTNQTSWDEEEWEWQ